MVYRKLFINNILKRVTPNDQIAKQTAQRLLYGDSRPFFALVGVSMAAGTTGMLTQESEFDSLCWEIRDSMLKKQKGKSLETEAAAPEGTISVGDLKFGKLIKQGCSAAVYSAEWVKPQEAEMVVTEKANEKESLAVKMLFNYDIESNASSIFRAMVREIVPAQTISLNNINELDKAYVKNVLPHYFYMTRVLC